MNKQPLANLVKSAQTWTKQHSPEILTGVGIAGMITTTVLAVKATPKALELIEEEKQRQNRELVNDAVANGNDVCGQIDKLRPMEVIKVAWKPYIPAAVTCAVSTACLIGASRVSARRNAALATAYQLSRTALSEYKDKVVETIGEKKEKSIRDAIDKDHLEENPVSKNEVIITEKGSTLCYDTISARYFKSDIDKIKRAENELNRRMLHDMFGYVSVNDLYDELGLDHIIIGDDLGWNVNELLDISFGSQIADDGQPCVVINYVVAPRRNYTTIM